MTLLIGTRNPYDGEPLAPHPPGCAGHRLWQMVSEVDPAITPDKYRALFVRTNIFDDPDYLIKLTKAISSKDSIVVFGDLAWRYLHLPRPATKLWPHPGVAKGVSWYFVPHPSGRNRWYNDPTNRRAVGELLTSLARL
jgi:hypothetical protein